MFGAKILLHIAVPRDAFARECSKPCAGATADCRVYFCFGIHGGADFQLHDEEMRFCSSGLPELCVLDWCNIVC